MNWLSIDYYKYSLLPSKDVVCLVLNFVYHNIKYNCRPTALNKDKGLVTNLKSSPFVGEIRTWWSYDKVLFDYALGVLFFYS